jgi:hypothetical protein
MVNMPAGWLINICLGHDRVTSSCPTSGLFNLVFGSFWCGVFLVDSNVVSNVENGMLYYKQLKYCMQNIDPYDTTFRSHLTIHKAARLPAHTKSAIETMA